MKSPLVFLDTFIEQCLGRNPFKTELLYWNTLARYKNVCQSPSYMFYMLCRLPATAPSSALFVLKTFISFTKLSILVAAIGSHSSKIVSAWLLKEWHSLSLPGSIISLILALLKRKICTEKKRAPFMKMYFLKIKENYSPSSEEVCVAWLAAKPQLFRSARLTNPAV